jgi:hypothetical protein
MMTKIKKFQTTLPYLSYERYGKVGANAESDASREWKRCEKLIDRAIYASSQEQLVGPVYEEDLFVPEIIIVDDILKAIASNLRRMICKSVAITDIA